MDPLSSTPPPLITLSTQILHAAKNLYHRFAPILSPLTQALYTHRHHLALSLFALYLINSLGLLKGGNMHPEAEAFIYNYLEPSRSFGEKIFDSILNDWGFYQSRELCYLTEWLDAHFIKAGILLGVPFFYSVVFYLLIALASYVHYRGCRTHLGFSPTTAALILAIFWFSPSIFASGYLFRTAKVGAAACIIIMAWWLYTLLREPKTSASSDLSPSQPPTSPARRALTAVGLFALTLAASLFDRQGFFMMIIFWGIVAIVLILGNQRHSLLAFLSVGTALAFAAFWNKILSPALILYFNGYLPNMEWQRITEADLTRYAREIGTSPYFDGFTIFIDTLRFVLGNFGTAQTIIIILILLTYTYTLHTPSFALRLGALTIPVRRFHCLLLGISLLALYIMATLMLLKHHPVGWQDMRRSYYHIPGTAVTLLILTYIVHLVLQHQTLKKTTVQIILSALLLFNLIELPIHTRFYLTGHSAPRIKESKDFLVNLRNLDEDVYGPTTGFLRSNFYRYFRDEFRRFHHIPTSISTTPSPTAANASNPRESRTNSIKQAF